MRVCKQSIDLANYLVKKKNSECPRTPPRVSISWQKAEFYPRTFPPSQENDRDPQHRRSRVPVGQHEDRGKNNHRRPGRYPAVYRDCAAVWDVIRGPPGCGEDKKNCSRPHAPWHRRYNSRSLLQKKKKSVTSGIPGIDDRRDAVSNHYLGRMFPTLGTEISSLEGNLLSCRAPSFSMTNISSIRAASFPSPL